MGLYIVSRQSLSRELIVSFLTSEGFQPDGVVESLHNLPPEETEPTILLHVGAGDCPESGQLAAFRGRCPEARIVLLATEQICGALEQAVLSNVEAVVSDRTSMRTLVGILTVVHQGFRVAPPLAPAGAEPPASLAALRPAAEPAAPTRPAATDLAARGIRLSERELCVIKKLRDGVSNKDIAKDLQIVESTVKVHLRACYRKIGVRNRTQAAIWAAQNLPG